MNLSQDEIQLFYKLWYSLIWNINEKHNIVPSFKKPVYGNKVNEEPFIAIREKLWDNPHWIEDFLQDSKSDEMTEDERDILKSWRNNFIKDKFLVMRHLRSYSVLMTFDEQAVLYGVYGISNPIRQIVPYETPFMLDAVLLPFKDKIIYDSFIGTYPVSFSSGIRKSANESYRKSKEIAGITETLGVTPTPIKPSKKKPPLPKPAAPVVDTKGANVPKNMSARYMEVAEIIEGFCDEKLNAEYKELCLKALAKLCRKRPSPLATGKAVTWACGIVYAIGSNNFIFDKSQPINMKAEDIYGWFGLSRNTAGSKATDVKKLLDLSYFNAEFMLGSHIDSNPMIWYLNLNGLPVDIRLMPREVQEQAFHKGLIPYIPADRE